jgi:hypothetical protein
VKVLAEVAAYGATYLCFTATAYYDVYVRHYWDPKFGPDLSFAIHREIGAWQAGAVVVVSWAIAGLVLLPLRLVGSTRVPVGRLERIVLSAAVPVVQWYLMETEAARSGRFTVLHALPTAIALLWGSYWAASVCAALWQGRVAERREPRP